MSTTETMQTRASRDSPAKFSEHPFQIRWLARIFGLCVAIVFLANLYSWPQAVPGLLGWFLAALSAVAVGAAFLLWEVVLSCFKSGVWGRGTGLAVLFFLAVTFDAIGVHNAIDVFMTDVRASIQAELDTDYNKRQADLQRDRRSIENEIAEARARVALVPAADTSGGHLNDAQENARWIAATASDTAEITARQAELNALPRNVERKEMHWLVDIGPWAGAFALEAIVAFGLSFLGIGVGSSMHQTMKPSPAPRKPKPPQSPPRGASQTAPNVIDLGASRGKRGSREADIKTVLRLHANGLSTREIERETKGRISKSRAQRLLKVS